MFIFLIFFLTPRNKSSHEYGRLVSFSPQLKKMLTTWHCGFPATVRVCPWFSSTPLVHWYRARPKGVTWCNHGLPFFRSKTMVGSRFAMGLSIWRNRGIESLSLFCGTQRFRTGLNISPAAQRFFWVS